jgi:hypothetical protein
VSDSDLVEVIKRNGEFRKWGPFWGPLLYLRSLNAARPPRSILWKGMVAAGTVVGGLLWRYGWLLSSGSPKATESLAREHSCKGTRALAGD